jgi:hypothetical protein
MQAAPVQPMAVIPIDQLPWPSSEAVSLPPAYDDFVPANPYVTIGGEEAIDRWLPWVSVAVFFLAVVINAVVAVASVNRGTSITTPSGMTAAVVTGIAVLVAIVFSIAVPAASGGLLLLGVFIGSQIMNFPNQRMLYWRCVAAACAAVGIDYTLKNIGLDLDVARWFLSVAVGLGVLWLLLRLRLPQFAVAGGFAALLGFLIPLGLIFGLKAVFSNLASRSTPMAMTPLPAPVPGTSSMPTYSPVFTSPTSPMPGSTTSGFTPGIPPGFITQPQMPASPSFRRPTMPVMPNFPQPTMPQFQQPQFQQPQVQQPQFPNTPTVPRSLTSDPGPALQKVATAYQQYFKTHGNTYPRNPTELVNSGDLTSADLHPFPGWSLGSMGRLPSSNALPADLIVVYLFSPSGTEYAALFGDWHVEKISLAEWPGVRTKSNAARRSALQKSP